MESLSFWPLILVAYIVGSLPVSYYLTWWSSGIKLDQVGTKNIGIANTFRHAPRWVGYTAVFADVAKVFSVLLPAQYWWGFDRQGLYILLVALILGNVFSLFLRFQGSKARTVTSWGLLLLSPVVFMSFLFLWGLIFLLTKNSRWGMAVVLAISPVAMLVVEGSWLVVWLSVGVSLLFATQNREQRDDFKYAGVGH